MPAANSGARPHDHAAGAHVCGNASLCETETCARAHSGLLGTGLGVRALLVVLAASIAVFLLWDGPIWLAPPTATHVERIGISYLLVPLLVELALRGARTRTTDHLLTATALLWAVKLVVTSSLYALLVGSADRYAPSRAWEHPPVAAQTAGPSGYRSASLPGNQTVLSGRVSAGGAPVSGAVVVLDAPPPGLPPGAPRDQPWVIRDGRHDEAVRLITVGDHVRVSSEDPVLHTLRITGGGRALTNLPLVAGVASREIEAPPPGEYALTCENHPRERAQLVVVDHPYATRTDATGSFVLKGVPAGRHALCVFTAGRACVRRSAEVAPGTRDVSLDVDLDRAGIGGTR